MIRNICKDCNNCREDKCTKINSFPIDIGWIEEVIVSPKDENTKKVNIKRLINYCKFSGKVLKELGVK